MISVGLSCSRLFVASSLLVAGITPGAAFYSDKATDQATQICDRNFAPGNPDAPFTRRSQARALDKACQYGASYAHESVYSPYADANSPAKDFPVKLPDLDKFREAYDQGFAKCTTGYDADAHLQERMACMDGYDYFAGNLVNESAYITGKEIPKHTFDQEYYKDRHYDEVYQDIGDDLTWAFVLADRVLHPERYPGYRRDQIYGPEIPADQREAARQSAQTFAGTTNVDPYLHTTYYPWYWMHSYYGSCYFCSYHPTTIYHADSVTRVSTAASDAAASVTTSKRAYGPSAPARDYAPTSPASSVMREEHDHTAIKGAVVGAAIGAATGYAVSRTPYGGYGRPRDASIPVIPAGRTITNTAGPATATMGGAAPIYRNLQATPYGAMNGSVRARMGTMNTAPTRAPDQPSSPTAAPVTPARNINTPTAAPAAPAPTRNISTPPREAAPTRTESAPARGYSPPPWAQAPAPARTTSPAPAPARTYSPPPAARAPSPSPAARSPSPSSSSSTRSGRR